MAFGFRERCPHEAKQGSAKCGRQIEGLDDKLRWMKEILHNLAYSNTVIIGIWNILIGASFPPSAAALTDFGSVHK